MRKSDRIRCGSGAGWTLAEVLVTVLLLAVLLALAVPGLTSLRSQRALQALAEEVWASLMLARSQALVHQQRVVLCPRTLQDSCDAQGQWQQGWLVFVDADRDGQPGAQELRLQRRSALPVGMQMQGNQTVWLRVNYGADGRSEGLGGTFTLCASGQAQAWRVVINALGRPRLEKTEVANCT